MKCCCKMHTPVESHAEYTRHYQFNSHRCHHRMHKLCGLRTSLILESRIRRRPSVCRLMQNLLKSFSFLSLLLSFYIWKCACIRTHQVPLFNGSSYLRFAPLGDTALIWLELKVSSIMFYSRTLLVRIAVNIITNLRCGVPDAGATLLGARPNLYYARLMLIILWHSIFHLHFADSRWEWELQSFRIKYIRNSHLIALITITRVLFSIYFVISMEREGRTNSMEKPNPVVLKYS